MTFDLNKLKKNQQEILKEMMREEKKLAGFFNPNRDKRKPIEVKVEDIIKRKESELLSIRKLTPLTQEEKERMPRFFNLSEKVTNFFKPNKLKENLDDFLTRKESELGIELEKRDKLKKEIEILRLIKHFEQQDKGC